MATWRQPNPIARKVILSAARFCGREKNMKNSGIHIALAATACLCAACTTTGTGGGELSTASGPDRQPVTFTWSSTDGGMTGNMTAQLPGATYQGRFFQLTQHPPAEPLVPAWGRWPFLWTDWPHGPSPYADPFIMPNSGKVVAALEAGDQRMRCRFQLSQPNRGMAGGGEGECQLSGGGSVRANFAPR
jgi:hypothetical protein